MQPWLVSGKRIKGNERFIVSILNNVSNMSYLIDEVGAIKPRCHMLFIVFVRMSYNDSFVSKLSVTKYSVN